MNLLNLLVDLFDLNLSRRSKVLQVLDWIEKARLLLIINLLVDPLPLGLSFLPLSMLSSSLSLMILALGPVILQEI